MSPVLLPDNWGQEERLCHRVVSQGTWREMLNDVNCLLQARRRAHRNHRTLIRCRSKATLAHIQAHVSNLFLKWQSKGWWNVEDNWWCITMSSRLYNKQWLYLEVFLFMYLLHCREIVNISRLFIPLRLNSGPMFIFQKPPVHIHGNWHLSWSRRLRSRTTGRF